jgi:hypothetical protein
VGGYAAVPGGDDEHWHRNIVTTEKIWMKLSPPSLMPRMPNEISAVPKTEMAQIQPKIR